MSENSKKNFKYNDPCGCRCGEIVYTNNKLKEYKNDLHRAKAARDRKEKKRHDSYRVACKEWSKFVASQELDVYDFLRRWVIYWYDYYNNRKTVSFDLPWKILAMELKPEVGQNRKEHPSLYNSWRRPARESLETLYPELISIINHRSLDQDGN